MAREKGYLFTQSLPASIPIEICIKRRPLFYKLVKKETSNDKL